MPDVPLKGLFKGLGVTFGEMVKTLKPDSMGGGPQVVPYPNVKEMPAPRARGAIARLQDHPHRAAAELELDQVATGHDVARTRQPERQRLLGVVVSAHAGARSLGQVVPPRISQLISPRGDRLLDADHGLIVINPSKSEIASIREFKRSSVVGEDTARAVEREPVRAADDDEEEEEEEEA